MGVEIKLSIQLSHGDRLGVQDIRVGHTELCQIGSFLPSQVCLGSLKHFVALDIVGGGGGGGRDVTNFNVI